MTHTFYIFRNYIFKFFENKIVNMPLFLLLFFINVKICINIKTEKKPNSSTDNITFKIVFFKNEFYTIFVFILNVCY